MCGGHSGAKWLPSHHPGGCCTLVLDEEISPLLSKALGVPRKALYKCNELLINYYSLFGADIVYISSNGGLQLLTQGWVYANRAASQMGETFPPR